LVFNLLEYKLFCREQIIRENEVPLMHNSPLRGNSLDKRCSADGNSWSIFCTAEEDESLMIQPVKAENQIFP